MKEDLSYSFERSTAIHEAGHAVMAYLLGRPFTSISVAADGNSLGRVSHARPGEWFRPDIEVNARTRHLIEDHAMICLAGAETEKSWCHRLPDVPEGWERGVDLGAGEDLRAALHLAAYVCGGSPPEIEAYVEWLR